MQLALKKDIYYFLHFIWFFSFIVKVKSLLVIFCNPLNVKKLKIILESTTITKNFKETYLICNKHFASSILADFQNLITLKKNVKLKRKLKN